MSAFAVDHLVIRAPGPEALAEQISRATGLPVLRGWTPEGVVKSRGVRFANGPFLDIFEAEDARPCHLGLRGETAATERLIEAHGWQARHPEEGGRFPWRLTTFRRGQGVLSAVFQIDYDRSAAAWLAQEFSGELYQPAKGVGAHLERIWIVAPESGDIGPMLPTGDIEVTIDAGPAAEVVRFEVSGASTEGELHLTPRLLMSVKAFTSR